MADVSNNNLNYMVLDTETTGLPKVLNGEYYPPSKTQYYAFSRLVELGYIIYDSKHNEIKRSSFLVKPDGFNVEATHVHQITHEHACDHGIPISDVFKTFSADLDTVGAIVAHNAQFDLHILRAECHVYNNADLLKKIESKTAICTKQLGAGFIKIESSRGPKLSVLYEHFFNTPADQIHRALDDVLLCAKCYVRMATQDD